MLAAPKSDGVAAPAQTESVDLFNTVCCVFRYTGLQGGKETMIRRLLSVCVILLAVFGLTAAQAFASTPVSWRMQEDPGDPDIVIPARATPQFGPVDPCEPENVDNESSASSSTSGTTGIPSGVTPPGTNWPGGQMGDCPTVEFNFMGTKFVIR